MSNLEEFFLQFGVKTSSNENNSSSSIYPKPQFVQLDSLDQIHINRTTKIQDLESSLFAKWSEEKDDDEEQKGEANLAWKQSKSQILTPKKVLVMVTWILCRANHVLLLQQIKND